MIKAQIAYVTTDGDSTVYDVHWSDGAVDLEMQVRVPRPADGRDYTAAEGMRMALEVARRSVSKLSATPDNEWWQKSFITDQWLPPEKEPDK